MTLSYFTSGSDAGKLQQVQEPGTDPGRRKLTFAYSGGRVSAITDTLPSPDTRIVQFAYDGSGNLQTVTSLGNAITTFGYDTNHLLTKMTDPLGHLTVKNCYDPATSRVYKQFGATTLTPPSEPPCTLARTDPSVTQYGIPITEFLYNTPGVGKTTLRDPRGNDTIYTFDNFFRVTKIQDPLNGATTRLYDAASNLLCETDALGNKTGYTYDSRGNILTKIDADNTDATCHLKANGAFWTSTYSSTNDVLTETDPLDHQTENRYDTRGNVTRAINRETLANGRVVKELTCYERGATTGQALAMVKSTNLYLPANNTDACSQGSGTGNRTLFGYNPHGDLVCTTGAFHSGSAASCAVTAKHSVSAFDDAGRLLSVTDELLHQTQFAYDNGDRLTTVTDALTNKTTRTYDAKGNLLTETNANRQPSVPAEACGTQGTGNGQDDDSDQIVDDGCPNLIYSYDNADRLTKVVEAAYSLSTPAPETTYSYDLAGNRVSVTNAKRQPVGAPETDCGTLGTGNGDNDGDLVSDDGCPSQLIAYDANNRVTQEIDALARVTSYFYDAIGNMTGRADGDKKQVGGSSETGTQCGGGTGNGDNEDAGPTDSIADDGCPNTTYQFDKLGQLRYIRHWNATLQRDEVEYRYDLAGNRQTMIQTPYDAAGSAIMAQVATANYFYDSLDRLTCFGPSLVNPSCPTGNTGYKWDDAVVGGTGAKYPGQRTRITYSDPSKTVDYTYRSDGRMATVIAWVAGTTTYGYDDAGRVTSVTYPTVADGNMKYSYDSANHLTNVVHTRESFATESFTYAYDAVGQRKTLKRCFSNLPCEPTDPITEGYTYDSLERLIRADYSTTSFAAYNYDSMGNRLTLENNTSVAEYHYDAANQLYHTGPISGGSALTYDNNGNLKTTSGQTFAYDPENRLIKVLPAGFDPSPQTCHDLAGGGSINIQDVTWLKPVFGTSVPPTSAWNDIVPTGNINILDVLALKPQFGKKCGTFNSYDGDGLRTAHWSGKFHTAYAWDVAGRLPLVLQETTKELHNDGDVPADVSSVVKSSVTYVYGLGLISATDQAGTRRFYFSDAIGSTVVRSGAGQPYKYDVFGNLREGDASAETFLFAGQQFDNNALGQGDGGLFYLRARYYDPTLGRFLTQDPVRGFPLSPQTANPYAYALNNPTNRVDPSGLSNELYGLGHYLSWECLNFALSAVVLGLSLVNPLIGLFAAPLLMSFAMVLAVATHDVASVPANAAVGAQSYSAAAFTNSALLKGVGFWAGYTGVMYNMASCIWGGSVIPPEPLQ
ncbi:MAG: RHS repeat-associated core domain-containing protein [Dehalococcoidia bacterium]